jgi:hypothetical protein
MSRPWTEMELGKDFCDLRQCRDDGDKWIAYPLGEQRATRVWVCPGCRLPQSPADAVKLEAKRA